MGTKGIKVIIAFICATLMLTACNKDDIDYIIRHNEDKVSINEGVAGTVYERYGDWMPCAGCSVIADFPLLRLPLLQISNPHTQPTKATPLAHVGHPLVIR